VRVHVERLFATGYGGRAVSIPRGARSTVAACVHDVPAVAACVHEAPTVPAIATVAGVADVPGVAAVTLAGRVLAAGGVLVAAGVALACFLFAGVAFRFVEARFAGGAGEESGCTAD
jgi:hypothetical protein